MSYCRFSSDDFKCDLYCYESNEGFITHVAHYRHRAWMQLVHYLTDKRIRVAPSVNYRVSRFNFWSWPKWLTHKRIGLPDDGKMFIDLYEQDMFARIARLSNDGYHIPEKLLREARGVGTQSAT